MSSFKDNIENIWPRPHFKIMGVEDVFFCYLKKNSKQITHAVFKKCHDWTMPQNISRLAESGKRDSRLSDICAHFLRKSMGNLNRIHFLKSAPFVFSNTVLCGKDADLVIFFFWPAVHMVPEGETGGVVF